MIAFRALINPLKLDGKKAIWMTIIRGNRNPFSITLKRNMVANWCFQVI